MTDKAYAYIDWPAVEGILYSDERSPREILAPRSVQEGTLYQCFAPGAETVFLLELKNGRRHRMLLEDEAGFFACVLPGKKPVAHHFIIDEKETGNPYAHQSLLAPEEESRFIAGIADRAYKLLGAHVTESDGEKGVNFALWAPNAIRVSVVGPFNDWDGRMYPMEYHEESGIFELFIPGLAAGTEYRYELKLATGLVYTRPDPFGFEFKMGEEPSSVVADLSYRWHDREYLTKRRYVTDTSDKPVAILECSLAALRARAEEPEEAGYRSLASRVASDAREMGYTHVELLPVMEYPDDTTNGYQTSGYFAPTSRFGTPADFKYFVDTMHEMGIGVILDWTPAQFTPDTRFLASFDGTCLFEHLDPRQGVHPLWGSKLFNYGRAEVRSFLLSSAVFWMREYHVDGLRLDGCSTMLRLDYAREDGGWVPNLYGTSENLDGIDFLKNLGSLFKKAYPDSLLIMAEDVDWPETTDPADEGGLGFTYKWNLHFTQDMLGYLSLDSAGKRREHDVLQRGMLHHYFEHFILSLSRGIGPFDREKFLARIDGSDAARSALLRAAYGFLFLHPGKKLLTSGEEFNRTYIRALLSLYRAEPALSILDYRESGFEWINTMDNEHSVLSFARKGEKKTDTLLVVCNFSDENFPMYQVGVPFAGKYKEILNSDSELFGGSGKVNPRAKASRSEEFDERPNSLRLRIAPRSIAVFRYQGK